MKAKIQITTHPNAVNDSVDQAAVRLGVSRAKIYQLISIGELASFKIGKRRLVSRTAQDEFLARVQAA